MAIKSSLAVRFSEDVISSNGRLRPASSTSNSAAASRNGGPFFRAGGGCASCHQINNAPFTREV